jgi:hypothetical protein
MTELFVGPSICNQYYLVTRQKEPVYWDIYNNNLNSEFIWATYHNKILQAVEKRLVGKGLIFYLTRDELDSLPFYGNNVVVIITADEWCRIPLYADRVLAVFKSYGAKPFIGCNLLLQPSYQNFISSLQFLRICLAYLPGFANYWLQISKSFLSGKLKIPKLYTIPLGYYNQPELPIKTLEKRSYDVFFAGSVFNDSSPQGSLKSAIAPLLRPPKTQSRQKMLYHLDKLKQQYPNFQVELSLTSGFFSMTEQSLQTYANKLMNSKICLIPRGTSFETYRFCEAIRYGCVPIVEALPSHWFYEGSPAIEIENWRNLPDIVEELLTNPSLMAKKHQQCLQWWQDKCSELTVSDYMVENLSRLLC